MDAAAEIGRNPVSKHRIQPENGEQRAGGRGTGRPNPSRKTKFSGIFPVELTVTGIGNLTRLTRTLLYV